VGGLTQHRTLLGRPGEADWQMKCPKCQRSFEATEFRGIELDVCRECAESW
jgi:hypothetical protein